MSNKVNDSRIDYLKELVMENGGKIPTEVIMKQEVTQQELGKLADWYNGYLEDRITTGSEALLEP